MIEGWKTVTSQTLHAGQRMILRWDEVVRPNGTTGSYTYIEQPDGVRVVALDDDHRVALLEEDVYVCGQRLLILPGGGCEAGETPEQAATRELAEEAGLTAGSVRLLTRMWRMPANIRTMEHLYLARDLHLGEHHREASEEDMALRWVPLDEAMAMCGDGRITEAGTLTALLLAARLLADDEESPTHTERSTNHPTESAVPLHGGRMTPKVVRIGNTVRRPASASSGYTAALLRHFEQRGFNGAPRYLGQTDGMDILTFIPGDVPTRFQVWSDQQVTAAGALLRSLHDASRGSELAGRSPVVCHHDPGPNNAVFVDGLPVAWIDFDTAAPGSPLEDLGYAAWTWCIASKHATSVERQAAQVRILVDAYGLTDPERGAVVDAVLEQQARNARLWTEAPTRPDAVQASPEIRGERIAWSLRELHFTLSNRAVFQDALT